MEWSANKVTRALDDDQDLESITIDFKLSTVKPPHAKWVMQAYNHMTLSIGKGIYLKKWNSRTTGKRLGRSFRSLQGYQSDQEQLMKSVATSS